MHYIRILKQPRLLPSSASQPLSVSAKVTITTDLGESFLLSNISLTAELELEDGSILAGKGREYLWRGRDGMRSLEIAIPVPVSKGKRKMGAEMVRMLVGPKDDDFAVDSFVKLIDTRSRSGDSGDEGGVVAVRSMAIDISPGAKAVKAPGGGMAERVFSLGAGDNKGPIRIWEETGESIARHIWYAAWNPDRDAGLILSSFLCALSLPDSSLFSEPPGITPQLPILAKALQQKSLNVLELGAGCGIVGISLATAFSSHISQVLLTDLPEATDILSHNLSPKVLPPPLPLPTSSSSYSKLSHQVLDWSSPLPPNVQSTNWHLVLVADCTYNPDVVPDLVLTLGRLAEGSGDVLVLVAMKVRHKSEMVFFDLMSEGGFEVKEKAGIPLPVLGGEGEGIEIFVFGVGK